MIFLDTNVISEFAKTKPDPAVKGWLESHRIFRYALTSITVAEIRRGIAIMPAGKRKETLCEIYEELFHREFPGQIMPFDARASAYFADICASRKEMGKPIGVSDAQIAAICRAYDSELATRNTKDFAHTGITTIDPWGESYFS